MIEPIYYPAAERVEQIGGDSLSPGLLRALDAGVELLARYLSGRIGPRAGEVVIVARELDDEHVDVKVRYREPGDPAAVEASPLVVAYDRSGAGVSAQFPGGDISRAIHVHPDGAA